ncbi:MAG: ParA family protein [Anaerolineales bacterium]|nr:ParA family protein [Anaerolineales bacterium]
MAYVIAISNEKGGVAKTTTTYSLGASLAESGKKILLIDLDPQGNLTLANGIEPGKAVKTSHDVLLNGLSITEAIAKTSTPGLEIVPASPTLIEAEQNLPLRSNYAFTLNNALRQGALVHEYVLLDCPPSMGALTYNALTAAELLIIPTQAEYFSAYALRDMMTLIRRVRRDSNPRLAYRILITLLDQRNRTHKVIREQLEQTFGSGLFQTVIEIDTRLRESPIIGLPITQYRPTSRGSQQYRVLAQELIEYVQQQKNSQSSQ